MKLKNTVSLKNSKGISLIELMVSMVLGLTIVSGLMGMYLGSRETDKTRTELIDIESNARFALKSLRDTIALTGYSSIEGIYLDKAFHTPKDGSIANPDCRDGNPMVVNSQLLSSMPTELADFTKDGVDGGSDRLTVIVRPDHPTDGEVFLDCAGGGYVASSSFAPQEKQIACSTDKENSDIIGDTAEGMENPSEARLYNGFYLKDKSLICAGSRTEYSTPYTVADNIENMQFLYGVLKDGRLQYKNANTVETGDGAGNDDWASVVSVQVAILVSSANDVLETADERKFQLLDVEVSKTSKKMLKVYQTTINLPNRQMRR